MSKSENRAYPEELRILAVNLVLAEGCSISRVSELLNIKPSQLWGWLRVAIREIDALEAEESAAKQKNGE